MMGNESVILGKGTRARYLDGDGANSDAAMRDEPIPSNG